MIDDAHLNWFLVDRQKLTVVGHRPWGSRGAPTRSSACRSRRTSWRRRSSGTRALRPRAQPDSVLRAAPGCVRIFAGRGAAGALWAKGLDEVHTYRADEQLNVPGRPRVVLLRAHTHGQGSLCFSEPGP